MPDLNDFGAGVDNNPGPENGVRVELSQWVRSNDVTVYWDQSFDFGFGTFSNDASHRPDMMIDAPGNTYVVEVKVGDDGGKLHDGFKQLVEYWRAYVDGDDCYYINGQERAVDGFLIADGNSPHGRLYKTEGEGDVLRTGVSEGRQEAAKAGHVPDREFNATERAIRVMWRLTMEQRPNATAGIGALLSSRLDGDQAGVANSVPAALYKSHGGQQPDGWDSPGHQWWDYIPFYARGDGR